MALGEAANFAAYAFAPAILVTPLGALSVLIGYVMSLLRLCCTVCVDYRGSSVLGAYFLNETLGTLGKVGCAECLIGSVIIVLHAPPDTDIETVDQILNYAVQPGTEYLSFCASKHALTMSLYSQAFSFTA